MSRQAQTELEQTYIVLPLNQLLSRDKMPFDVSQLQLVRYPNVLAFESFLILLFVSKLLCDQLLVILQVQVTPDMILQELWPPILRL